MPGCALTKHQRRGRTELHLAGTFDGPAAWELAERLSSERGELVVDFGRVDVFNDYGLATLAHALLELRGRGAVLLGLRHHQLRLLRYLGVNVSDAGVVEPAPEPASLAAPPLSLAHAS
jgi:anti-anti-sigma regulatory factor